jgi:hypothetical protein
MLLRLWAKQTTGGYVGVEIVRTFGIQDSLELADILGGFTCSVAELFE